MTEGLEWYKTNLKRSQDHLAALEAACGSPEAASRNFIITELRKKVSLIEKIVAANDPQAP
jgi:hypothetical protein